MKEFRISNLPGADEPADVYTATRTSAHDTLDAARCRAPASCRSRCRLPDSTTLNPQTTATNPTLLCTWALLSSSSPSIRVSWNTCPLNKPILPQLRSTIYRGHLLWRGSVQLTQWWTRGELFNVCKISSPPPPPTQPPARPNPPLSTDHRWLRLVSVKCKPET